MESEKRHKRHKRDKEKSEGYSGNPLGISGIKMILKKMGGSATATPERSNDSTSGSASGRTGMNLQLEADDSQQSSLFAQHVKKSKKDKKKKKDKKHKHHHKDKKRGKEIKREGDDEEEEESMDIDESSIKIQSTGTPMKIEVSQQMHVKENKVPQGPPPKKAKFIEKQPFQKLLDYLVCSLETKDSHQFFAWPVTDKIAHGYSAVIKKPMDFSTMKSKIENESYSSLSAFREDFKLMCNNAMTYNPAETIYHKAAKKLLQGGTKLLSPDKIKRLLPMIPSIRLFSEEHVGSSSLKESGPQDVDSDDDMVDFICLDPAKNVHYMTSHLNDPLDTCGAFTDDLTTEEVLLQARLAAREAAHRLATKKPNPKMGFLRQKQDGSTSLAILTPTSGILPGTKELPISLGALSGKLTHGTAQVQSFKEDKKNMLRIAKPVFYGAFSSFAPTHDTAFSNMNQEEAEVLGETYGGDCAVQYAESMIEFAKGCDYTICMVDEILDTITKGEHRKTVNFIEERKKIEAEEAQLRSNPQQDLGTQLEMEWQDLTQVPQDVNIEALTSLSDIGIDTKFLDDFKQDNSAIGTKLCETAQLIGDLHTVQNERLGKPPMGYPPYAPQITEAELGLATRITDNLTEMAKQMTPGDLIAPESIRKIMGIDIDSSTYNPPTPQQ